MPESNYIKNNLRLQIQWERELEQQDAPDLEWAVDWIRLHLDPEDVFSVEDLVYWAEHNGFDILHDPD